MTNEIPHVCMYVSLLHIYVYIIVYILYIYIYNCIYI